MKNRNELLKHPVYSPFCEPSFVKGGVFHSGKIAFNTMLASNSNLKLVK